MLFNIVGKWNDREATEKGHYGNFKGISSQIENIGFYGLTLADYKGKYVNDARKIQIGGFSGIAQKNGWEFSK
jgi:hypothetical protein